MSEKYQALLNHALKNDNENEAMSSLRQLRKKGVSATIGSTSYGQIKKVRETWRGYNVYEMATLYKAVKERYDSVSWTLSKSIEENGRLRRNIVKLENKNTILMCAMALSFFLNVILSFL